MKTEKTCIFSQLALLVTCSNTLLQSGDDCIWDARMSNGQKRRTSMAQDRSTHTSANEPGCYTWGIVRICIWNLAGYPEHSWLMWYPQSDFDSRHVPVLISVTHATRSYGLHSDPTWFLTSIVTTSAMLQPKQNFMHVIQISVNIKHFSNGARFADSQLPFCTSVYHPRNII